MFVPMFCVASGVVLLVLIFAVALFFIRMSIAARALASSYDRHAHKIMKEHADRLGKMTTLYVKFLEECSRHAQKTKESLRRKRVKKGPNKQRNRPSRFSHRSIGEKIPY